MPPFTLLLLLLLLLDDPAPALVGADFHFRCLYYSCWFVR
jgi:hypothetical protein